MEERLREMRKGRSERMRKGVIVSSSPQGITSWSSSIKIWFFSSLYTVKNGVNSIHSRGVPQTGLKLPPRVYSKGV